jgi:hypothetical protein
MSARVEVLRYCGASRQSSREGVYVCGVGGGGSKRVTGTYGQRRDGKTLRRKVRGSSPARCIIRTWLERWQLLYKGDSPSGCRRA